MPDSTREKRRPPFAIGLALLALALGWASGGAQRPEPKLHGIFDGDSMFAVLPLDAIPAIREPEFLSGKEADAQMSPEEPVIGIVLDGEARAYSMWQLDSHEIVNDRVGEKAFAVTW
jgi:hypothetical protein